MDYSVSNSDFFAMAKKFGFYSTVSTFSSAKAKLTSAFTLAIAECWLELEWLDYNLGYPFLMHWKVLLFLSSVLFHEKLTITLHCLNWRHFHDPVRNTAKYFTFNWTSSNQWKICIGVNIMFNPLTRVIKKCILA